MKPRGKTQQNKLDLPQNTQQQQPTSSTAGVLLTSSSSDLINIPRDSSSSSDCCNEHEHSSTISPSIHHQKVVEHHHRHGSKIVMQQTSMNDHDHDCEPTLSSSSLHPISCTRCKQRHTRCDRKLPACSFCSSNNLECMYEKPKRLRKNYNVECVDLQNMHASSTSSLHLQKPKSKYKVYKFSLNNKTKGEENEETIMKNYMHNNQLEVEMPAIELVEQSLLQFENIHANVTSNILELRVGNDIRLFAIKFLQSSLGYYSKYISFGNDILTRADVLALLDLTNLESLQLFPDDLLALMYASQALTLYFQEEHEQAEEYYDKCMKILEEETESNRLLCLSTTFGNRTMFFTENRMDSQSLFLIGTRLILCQYKLAMGNLEHAVKFVRLVDTMLEERFPVFKEQSFLPRNANEMPSSLFDGLSREEILIIKKRIHCGALLDELKFNLEDLKGYIQAEPILSSSLYNNQSFILKESNTFQFSSFVNRFVFGNSLDIRGKCKYEMLCLLQSPNVIYRNQTNVPFLIMGIVENNVQHLEEEALEQLGIRKVQAISLNESSSLDVNEYNQVVLVLQKVYLTSCSLLVLHEIITNSSQDLLFSQMQDGEIIAKCKIWRKDFADELSDYYALLPTETVNICLLVVAVFVVASIHADLIQKELLNKTSPPESLVRRMRSDYRMLTLLKRKFSNWFGSYHNKLCEDIENLLSEIVILNKENL